MRTKYLSQSTKFSMLYLINYMVFSFVSSQRKTFLITTGYTTSQIALIYAVIPIFQILTQLLVGYLSDRFDTVKKLMIYLIAFASIMAFFFYSLEVQFYILHFALGIISQSFTASAVEFSDVWVMGSDKNTRDRYGFIRSFGSLGWSVGSYLLAQIIINLGYSGLAKIILLLSALILLIVSTITESERHVESKDIKEATKISDIIILVKDKYYLSSILIVFSIFMASNMSSFVLIDKSLSLGGSVLTIGLINVVAAGSEIPLLIFGNKILDRIGIMNMLIIGIIAYAIQFLLYFLSNSNELLIIISAMQFVSLPFYNIAIKNLMFEMSPDHLKSTGQLTGPAIVSGTTSIIYPLISAYLITHFSTSAPFLVCFVMSIIGLSVAVLLKRSYQFNH